jgi:hypothetical protein
MTRLAGERASGPNPIRFVLTTGDNIYADWNLSFWKRNTGDKDQHWEKKFFLPYETLLRSLPMYPSPGNHDGDASESAGDLPAYLDNFFFPVPEASRYYSFDFGGLADFFSLDTTTIRTGSGRPIFEEGGAQQRWLEEALSRSKAPWKIAYFHHPPFNAGPGHSASLNELRHYVDLLGRHKVAVAFSGHEHNFQWVQNNQKTHGVQYVICGAGGQLRSGDISRKLAAANIEAWAPQNHFLLVEIEGRQMKVYVLGAQPVAVRDRQGRPVTLPFRLRL